MSKKSIEIITKPLNESTWWKEPFVTVNEEEKSIQLTISHSKAHLVGSLETTTIQQLKFAEYSVVRVEDEKQLYQNVYIPLSESLPWKGIKTILENCGYKVTVIAG